MTKMDIRHLRHNEIERDKWDQTISQAQCDLPYAYTWWLDAVCPQWEALVTENYEYVMPLPLKEQKGIKYLVHPVWTQQLGIYSARTITQETYKQFKKSIPYLIYAFNINHTNYFGGKGKKTNLIIDCDREIDTIRKEYSTNTKRNIKKARKAGLEIKEIETEQLVAMWEKENVASKPLQHTTIKPLIDAAEKAGKGHRYGIYENGELVAALFGVETRKRFIYLIPVSNQRGKEVSAMFMMVDEIIENLCCKKKLTFDCEGSMIPGVARFYHGLGAKEQPYGEIKHCHPTWLVKLLHR